MDFSYYNPVRMEFGQNKFSVVGEAIEDRRALLVTMPVFKELGFVDEIKAYTENIVFTLDDVEAQPNFINLRRQYDLVWKNDFDVIVALGGGSVIDTAKVLSVFNPEKEFDFIDDLIREKIAKSGYNKIPVIAIPTTAGTGSEVTPWATVWDTDRVKKYSLHLKDLWCETAILDPCLTLSMSRSLTIQTALDALSHALEAIWNKNANYVSTAHGIRSSRDILKNLPLALRNLFDVDYREKLLLASFHAGLAFSNTQTSIAHAISYFITGRKGTPHGIACSFTLPDIIDAVVGQDIIIDNAIRSIFGEVSSIPLRKFFAHLGVSVYLKDYGIKKDELFDLKNSLISNQRASNSLINNSKLFNIFEKQFCV
ncbi:MAG: phosphonoacetaldehyde reductase [bacterium]